MRTEPSTAKGRATVQRILDAACVLFARQGIRATTLDQVGAASGSGRGQLYLYFTGKAGLVAAVVAQQVQRVLDAQQPLLGTIATAADVRRWCALAAEQYAADDVMRCPIGSLVHELGERDGAARAALADGFARWRDALAMGLRRAQQHGELAPGADPDAVAAALLAAYQGGVLLAGALGDRDLLRLALDGVTRPVLRDV
ncbi:TetR/AcrR family transcriptional regulator [Pseudonocardia broussonetiae]|uniref:TetR/AcrR family transcriptional regulator n=1 Tax=Pseudonocardia broussonetiae TaxID=2736640 RepID=A0A6M6JVS8_9PSEU|nr:TetR/AcrR family transcriptional regulator [Pseudonocardia broussonetiae]QJY51157.1 TetR/AcrR family transcriptional regulator [Pseudonocardia broussonetiae]